MSENNNNLSIDEILLEAEKVLQRIEEKSKKTINEIKSIEEPLENDEDVKPFTLNVSKKNEDEEVKTFISKENESEEVKTFTLNEKENNEKVKTFVPNRNKTDKIAASVRDKTVTCEKVCDQDKTAVVTIPKNDDKTAVVTIPKNDDKTTVIKVSKNDDKTKAIHITDKTSVVPNVARSKKRFFKSNSKDLDYNPEPPQIIEKAATIKSKSRFKKTSDLQEIPTILAVEELGKTRASIGDSPLDNTNSNLSLANDYDSSAQIKMSGFDDEMDKVPTIDEDVAEKLLKQRREDKVNKFRLFAREEVEVDKKSEAKKIMLEDYKVTSDKTDTMEHFFKKKTSLQSSIIMTIIFGIPLFLITVLGNTPYLPSFFYTENTYYITVIVLYALILICNYAVIFHGFNFRHGLNFDFPITIVALLTMGHTVAMFLNPELALDGGALYPSAATFALILSLFGKKSMMVRIIENFEFLTNSEDKYTVEDIVNEVDAAIISRNLLVGEPLLKYSVKTDFPTSFLEISCADEPADRISKTLGPVMIALNLALFGVFTFYLKDINVAFNIFMAGMIISCPVISLYATNNVLKNVSRSLSKKGALVCGFEGAHVTHKSNALVMEASDLFGPRSCDLHGIKTFNGTKIDDAILQTAAVIMKTNSPLSTVFDDVIVGKQSILPQVDGVIYEDRMGTSAWIYQKKILVGNRDLLIRHGVAVPKEEYEKKYTRKGRKALYLAVAGKVSAMFVVSYSADDTLKRSLKKLEKSGITILLRSTDPYINETSVMEIFDLPEGFVRVMTSSNARTFEKYSSVSVEKSPAYTVHNGTALGFISGIRGSEALVNIESMLSILVSFGCAIGFGVVALLGFVDGLSQLNSLSVIIFQAIWSIFVLLISKIRRSGI